MSNVINFIPLTEWSHLAAPTLLWKVFMFLNSKNFKFLKKFKFKFLKKHSPLKNIFVSFISEKCKLVSDNGFKLHLAYIGIWVSILLCKMLNVFNYNLLQISSSLSIKERKIYFKIISKLLCFIIEKKDMRKKILKLGLWVAKVILFLLHSHPGLFRTFGKSLKINMESI